MLIVVRPRSFGHLCAVRCRPLFGILFRLDIFFVAMINLVTVCAHDNDQMLALFKFIGVLFRA